MAGSTVGVRLATWTLALLLPIAVVAGSLVGMEKFRSFDDRREDRNAGKVINGRVVKGGVAGVIESKLEQTEPSIVILGNSLSNTNVNMALLAKRLDLPKNKVARFSIPNSMAAHWYAITKNRIYANGHEPKIIFILSDLQSLLALAPRSEASYLNLSVQLSEDEPFLDEKLGRRIYFLERVRENRGKVRDMAMVSARNLLVDLLLYRSVVTGNEKEIGAALERVFDASKTDMRLHNNVIPIYNSKNDHELVIFDPESLAAPEESFLAEIARMANENGGRVVFVRPPMSPMLPEGIGDIVLPEHEAAVQPLMDKYNGVYLDLRELEMDVTHFENVDHMNAEGSRRFTEIVSELFQDLDVGTGERRAGADLLKSVAVVDSHYAALPLDLQFKDPPPDVPRADREWAKGRGRLMYFETSAFEFLHDARTMELSPHASRCSPLRVLQDGAVLPHPNESCEDALKRGMGRTCHTPERLYFTTVDDSNPFVVRHKFKMTLDAQRTCDGGLWLYPNDRVRINLRPYDVQMLPHGAALLSVLASDLGSTERGGEPYLGVKVRAAGTLRLDDRVSIEQLTTIGGQLRLDPRVASGAQNVQVELFNQSDRFLLLSSLRLDGAPRAGAQGP
jgi:hypothetical protein